jgi:hypothetical protein
MEQLYLKDGEMLPELGAPIIKAIYYAEKYDPEL